MRYAWNVDKRSKTDPLAANLCNSAGLPAVPFRASIDEFEIISLDYTINENELTVTTDYKNNSSMNTLLVLCAYGEGGELVGVKVIPAGFDYNKSIDLAETFTVTGIVQKVKVIALLDMTTLTPLCTYAEK